MEVIAQPSFMFYIVWHPGYTLGAKSTTWLKDLLWWVDRNVVR